MPPAFACNTMPINVLSWAACATARPAGGVHAFCSIACKNGKQHALYAPPGNE